MTCIKSQTSLEVFLHLLFNYLMCVVVVTMNLCGAIQQLTVTKLCLVANFISTLHEWPVFKWTSLLLLF